jgi:hypothetical protein
MTLIAEKGSNRIVGQVLREEDGKTVVLFGSRGAGPAETKKLTADELAAFDLVTFPS